VTLRKKSKEEELKELKEKLKKRNDDYPY